MLTLSSYSRQLHPTLLFRGMGGRLVIFSVSDTIGITFILGRSMHTIWHFSEVCKYCTPTTACYMIPICTSTILYTKKEWSNDSFKQQFIFIPPKSALDVLLRYIMDTTLL